MTEDRRLAALRAMANQDDSPRERDIAREKLRRLASLQVRIRTRAEEEAEATAERVRQEEADRRTLIRRWEHGSFSGLVIRAGASGHSHEYRKASK